MTTMINNLKYKMKQHFIWSLWYMGIYALSMGVVYYTLIATNVISHAEGSLFYRLWGIVFFHFGVSIKFREDFNFLLTMSNTRKNIFTALITNSLMFSVLFSVYIMLEKILVDSINQAMGFFKIVDPFHYVSPYRVEGVLLPFMFFLGLCLFASVSGTLFGSLFYRFGKTFTLVFWLVFSAVPFLILPLFLFYGDVKANWVALISFLRNFSVPEATLNLFIFTIIAAGAAWLNIRRLPQEKGSE